MSIFSIAIITLPMLVTVGVIAYIIFEKSIIYVLFLLAQKIDKILLKTRKKK
jgi:hypothetical protein